MSAVCKYLDLTLLVPGKRAVAAAGALGSGWRLRVGRAKVDASEPSGFYIVKAPLLPTQSGRGVFIAFSTGST